MTPPPAPDVRDAPDAAPSRPALPPEAGAALLAWYDASARALPWRSDRSPYRTWISETMLQQTRVAAVVPYFERWMATFPDVRALAAADEREVLALWEGLGYYRRARALHEAARLVARERGGRLPTDAAGWRALPGVGPYTAAAVAALAHGERVVAVDGNVRRVGARLFALPRPRDRELAERLAPAQPTERAGAFVEASIELGALVCAPRAPRCDACPLRPWCAAHASGEPARWPEPRPRTPPRPVRRWAEIRLRSGPDGARARVARRPSDGLLGGMWGPPQSGSPLEGRELEPVHHVYTHLRLELVPVLVEAGADAGAPEEGDGVAWIRLDGGADPDAPPLSRVDRLALERVREALSGAPGDGGAGPALVSRGMAKPEQLERRIARALQERMASLKDPRVPIVVTVERVVLSRDKERAKVLVSTLDEAELGPLLEALERARGYLQRELGDELGLRRTPKLAFTGDPLEALS